jgi:histidyl-tRNA synthetase
MLDHGFGAGAVAKLHAITKLRTIPDLLEALGPDAPVAEPLQQTVDALEAMGLGEFVDVDLTIVRGLAYYTGTVFELFDAGRTLRAICGGGRYDSLTGAMGGVELPAVGFGMGDVVLGELLKEKGKLPAYAGSIDVFVAGEGPEQISAALKLTHLLRDSEIRAEYALGAQTMSKQVDIANARNARLLITLVSSGVGTIHVRDLQTKAQHTVPLAKAVSEIQKLLVRATD